MEDLYTIIKTKRKKLNLSLRDASKLIGISHSYLSTLEKGIDPRNDAPVKPTPETLQLISKAYNIEYNNLMEKAGYIQSAKNEVLGNTQSNKASKLTRRDEREIEKAIAEFVEGLKSAEGLMFSGQPATPEAIESLINSMRLGMEIAKQRNKEKYTPKKYRKNKEKD